MAPLDGIRADGSPVAGPDTWDLALVSWPQVGLIYPHLPTDQARQEFLQLIFTPRGLHVDGAGVVRVAALRPGFEVIGGGDGRVSQWLVRN